MSRMKMANRVDSMLPMDSGILYFVLLILFLCLKEVFIVIPPHCILRASHFPFTRTLLILIPFFEYTLFFSRAHTLYFLRLLKPPIKGPHPKFSRSLNQS